MYWLCLDPFYLITQLITFSVVFAGWHELFVRDPVFRGNLEIIEWSFDCQIEKTALELKVHLGSWHILIFFHVIKIWFNLLATLRLRWRAYTNLFSRWFVSVLDCVFLFWLAVFWFWLNLQHLSACIFFFWKRFSHIEPTSIDSVYAFVFRLLIMCWWFWQFTLFIFTYGDHWASLRHVQKLRLVGLKVIVAIRGKFAHDNLIPRVIFWLGYLNWITVRYINNIA